VQPPLANATVYGLSIREGTARINKKNPQSERFCGIDKSRVLQIKLVAMRYFFRGQGPLRFCNFFKCAHSIWRRRSRLTYNALRSSSVDRLCGQTPLGQRCSFCGQFKIPALGALSAGCQLVTFHFVMRWLVSIFISNSPCHCMSFLGPDVAFRRVRDNGDS